MSYNQIGTTIFFSSDIGIQISELYLKLVYLAIQFSQKETGE